MADTYISLIRRDLTTPLSQKYIDLGDGTYGLAVVTVSGSGTGTGASSPVYVSETTLHAGEDLVNNRQLVEQRFNLTRCTSDTLVKTGAGFIHTATFSATGVVTAGTITIYDNTAESGTIIWAGIIQTGINPTTITLDGSVSTGIYVGFDGTIANVAVTVSYR